ncbi:oligopeptide transporter, OPT family [Megasphaera hexanoica]|uniref:Oligopeptide transporter, OPT family n=1 Tax=Megasphaera hexanoica TaxID=1675036 RepID=A0A848BVW9_9FIRM|nr:oligopeptide transporter, OPT family [Megasphaera hexanoica]NME27217.1 oligopeptide transporter, OPT family [Megasphaera hexanoica]
MKRQSNLTATYPTLPELTFRGMFLGMLITVIFTASNVYLGLKVGLTFSSSIPAAVISMAILRMFKNSNILENNMVQTQASAAGTLSAIIFILPGLLMLGYWQGFPFWQTLLLCACGGSLGVLFTIPLRRAMVVNSDLPYPEGRAAAEILKVGSEIRREEAAGEDTSKKETGMKDIVLGTGMAGIFSFCANGLHIASSEFSHWIQIGQAVTQLPMGFSMALLGAGYLIGIASGIAILTGTLLAWVIFVPYLTSVISPAEGQGAAAFAQAIWAQKVRFIGAGCIGIAAIWTLIRLAKPVVDGIKMSINAIRANDTEEKQILHHTDIDMSPKSVGIVFLVILAGLFVTFYSFVSAAGLPTTVTIIYIVVGILVAMLMGFFVAAACGYMAGLIGTSASPISGIGILGIIVSSLVVLGIGSSFGVFATPEGTQFATALAIFITAVIVSIAAISNDNLQDLKTGYIVGATPWKQQVALILGSVIGAFAIAPVLNLLYQAYGFTGALPRAGMDPSQALAAPQATLMTTIAQGIFSASLDWNYILFGIVVGIAAIIVDMLLKSHTKSLALPPLAIGMGIYLPPTLEIPLVIGSVMGWFIHRYLHQRAALRSPGHEEEDVEACNHRGVLFASGLIVGESLVGVIIALIIVVSVTSGGSENPLALVGKDFETIANGIGFAAFIATIAIFVRHIVTTKFTPEK